MTDAPSAEELTTWRAQPVTVRVLDWLKGRIETYRTEIPAYIVRNEIEKARAASGALRGYEEVLSVLTAEGEGPKAEETEDEFRDPAARPTRKDGNAPS